MVRVRKFIHDPKELYDEACRIVEERDKHDPDFISRVVVVKAILGGMSTAEAASMLGVSAASAIGWVRKADEEGFDSLHNKPRPSRSRSLSDEQ